MAKKNGGGDVGEEETLQDETNRERELKRGTIEIIIIIITKKYSMIRSNCKKYLKRKRKK